MDSVDAFTCSICGKTHEGLPTDRAFRLPDAVWLIPESDRASRAQWTSDLCQMGDDYFIRCLLPVPMPHPAGYFGWGVWVGVESKVFEHYLKVYEQDATSEPEVEGKLANQLPGYEPHIGMPLLVQFGTSSQRPKVRFPGDATHQIAIEQSRGISAERYHRILEIVGAI